MIPITILLVDDNPTFLKVAVDFLMEHGRKEVGVIGQAGGGYEALSMAENLQPQVIVVDLAMPDLPGLSLIPRLRKMLPEAGIIVLSMLDTKRYREAAISVGADGFVSKADMFAHLIPAIRQAAQSRRRETNRQDREASRDE
jgi:two-component system response regulator NreC